MTIYRPKVSINFITKSVILIFSICTISLVSSCSVAGIENRNGCESKSTEFEPSSEKKTVDLQKRANINNIPNDLLIHIGSFLNNPFISLGLLNRRFFTIIHQKIILKQFVMERFNIPELRGVDGNTLELSGIFNLAWCSKDPFLLFSSLMEDIASEKKPYRVIFRPLILHLARTFKELNKKHRDNFTNYIRTQFNCSFESHLANLCAKRGHYDLIFEFLRGIPEDLIKCFPQIKNRQHLMEFFKSNPHLAIQYENTLINIGASGAGGTIEDFPGRNIFKWISDCILYDAPEEFYTDMFNFEPRLLKRFIGDLFASFRDAPESEYPRIQIQMIKLIDAYLGPLLSMNDYEFYNLIIDIRFGPEDSQSFDPSNYDEGRLVFITKAALIANKRNLFFEIYDKNNNYNESNGQSKLYRIMDSFVKMIKFDDFSMQKYNFKLIFELLASNTEALWSSDYLIFIMNFYAINGLKTERDQFIFEFVALEELVALGFPPVIHAKSNNQYEIREIIDKVFSFMKVVNEETVSSFIDEYEKCPIIKKGKYCASFELLELISKAPNLLKKLIDLDIKFYLMLNSENFSKYFDLPNFEETSQIMSLNFFVAKILSEMKSENHVKKLDKLLKVKNGFVHFLGLESKRRGYGAEITECEYFKWRLFFAYWIKSDQKKRIREITSPAIIELLNLEFPGEMNQIFQIK